VNTHTCLIGTGECFGDIFLVILDVIRQLIVQLVQFGEVGAQIDLARLLAQKGLMRGGVLLTNSNDRRISEKLVGIWLL